MKPPLPNTYWVRPGTWLAGEYPGGANERQTRERLAKFAAAGIDSYLDLTEPGELEPYAPLLPPGTQYLNLPLPDHSVPGEKAHMLDVLGAIDAALATGRKLYLHCRAGIGRTGMSVACHLADGGLRGEQALLRLNELWQQNARSKHWPSVPETDEQAEYVRRWSSTPAPEFDEPMLSAAQRLRDRFQGALLGLALGDALAAPTQFRKPGSFAPVGDLLGGGPFNLPRGGWSDDTAMALCLAESLVETDGMDNRDQAERYRRWQREGHLSATGECLGITPTVARCLALSGWRRNAAPGSHDPSLLEKEALSRLAPAVMFFLHDAALAIEAAADAARISHQAPLVLDACRLSAVLLHAALSGAGKQAILEAGAARRRSFRGDISTLAGRLPDLAAAESGTVRGDGNIAAALTAAVWAFASSRDYREGALKAVNLGADSDVTAAVHGALAGAHYGARALPAPWRDSLLQREIIVDLADRLLAAALQGPGDSDEPIP
jgi:ADP-ribosyl-[dinitrogen reductase] hydrolase